MNAGLSLRFRRMRHLWRISVVIGATGFLAACSLFGDDSGGTYSSIGTGITASGPVPHGGGYDMVGRPYQVGGRTYTPQEDPTYSQVGTASWYGADFHGQRTANGEYYDMTALTAAHKTLPLPSYVRVTNLQNGASIVVRVNDRGPFVDDRIIDLSAQAANMLGFYNQGTAQVRVDYVGRASLAGDDTHMLMATYTPPGGSTDTAIAYNAATQQVAMATDAPVRRPFNPFSNGAAAAVFDATALPAGTDPLADLAGDVRQGYAEEPTLTPAQQAIQQIATAAPGSGSPAPAPAPAPAVPTDVLIQVGVFGDHDNVDRIADALGTYGRVSIMVVPNIDQTMWSVRVTTSSSDADAAIAAAAAAGAPGAHIL